MRAPHELGGHSDGETPLPIPNREVKPVSADGTRGEIPWESRTPPISLRRPREGPSFFSLAHEPRLRRVLVIEAPALPSIGPRRTAPVPPAAGASSRSRRLP